MRQLRLQVLDLLIDAFNLSVMVFNVRKISKVLAAVIILDRGLIFIYRANCSKFLFYQFHQSIISTNISKSAVLKLSFIKGTLNYSSFIQGTNTSCAHSMTTIKRKRSVSAEIISMIANTALIFSRYCHFIVQILA